MRRLWEEIDFEVTPMLCMFVFLAIVWMVLLMACFGWWSSWVGWCCLGAVVLIPQGRIFTRAFLDYPTFNQPKGMYLVANEIQVMLFAAVAAGAWFLLERLFPRRD